MAPRVDSSIHPGGGGRRTVPWIFLSRAVSRSLLRRACLEAFLSLFFSWLAEAGIWHEGVRQML